MAYQLLRREGVLEFDEEGLAAAEVRCKLDIPIGVLFEIERSISTDPLEGIRAFANNALVSWNIEDESGPVAADADGALSLPIGIILRIIKAWVSACASLPLA